MADTISSMTKNELEQLIESAIATAIEEKFAELLGDPDEGLTISASIHDRLLRQKSETAAGRIGRSFSEVVTELGIH